MMQKCVYSLEYYYYCIIREHYTLISACVSLTSTIFFVLWCCLIRSLYSSKTKRRVTKFGLLFFQLWQFVLGHFYMLGSNRPGNSGLGILASFLPFLLNALCSNIIFLYGFSYMYFSSRNISKWYYEFIVDSNTDWVFLIFWVISYLFLTFLSGILTIYLPENVIEPSQFFRTRIYVGYIIASISLIVFTYVSFYFSDLSIKKHTQMLSASLDSNKCTGTGA